MMPEILMIESDHDMRNPTDFIVLHKLAKAVFAVPGISRVQGITRPEGNPIEHTSIPFMISLQMAGQVQMLPFQANRAEGMLKQADDMTKMINIMQRQYDIMQRMTDLTHRMVATTHEHGSHLERIAGSIADFDDFFRPIRNYLYWEPHCYNIPICWAFDPYLTRSTASTGSALKCVHSSTNLDQLDAIMPQISPSSRS